MQIVDTRCLSVYDINYNFRRVSMTKFLSLLAAAGIGILAAGCADDSSSNSSTTVTPEVNSKNDCEKLYK